jgi:hypothetical protein
MKNDLTATESPKQFCCLDHLRNIWVTLHEGPLESARSHSLILMHECYSQSQLIYAMCGPKKMKEIMLKIVRYVQAEHSFCIEPNPCSKLLLGQLGRDWHNYLQMIFTRSS